MIFRFRIDVPSPFCSADVAVQYKYGRPVLALPLPSRREMCLFYLRPMIMSVSDLIQDLQREDPGITDAAVLTTGRSTQLHQIRLLK